MNFQIALEYHKNIFPKATATSQTNKLLDIISVLL